MFFCLKVKNAKVFDVNIYKIVHICETQGPQATYGPAFSFYSAVMIIALLCSFLSVMIPDCILDPICARSVASKNDYRHSPIVI